MKIFKQACLVMLVLGVLGCQKTLFWGDDKQKNYITQLQDCGMYQQAAREYEILGEKGDLSDEKRANVFYLAGNIYYENLKQYDNALSCFLKAKVLKPQRGLAQEIERKIVASLEYMGKSFDAQKKLDAATDLLPQKKSDKSKIVARIGSRVITMNELENEVRLLPTYMQKDFVDNKKKLEFLKQFIATELMYDSALRRQYDRKPEFLSNMERLKKNLMVQMLIEEDIASKVSVSEQEVQAYYNGNKDKLVDKNKKPVPLGQARDQIASYIKQEKERSEYEALFNQLMQAKKVEIYEDAF